MKKILPLLFLLLSFNLYSQSYSELENSGLENKSLSSLVTGDLNNDGYIDIITTGIDETSELSTSVYINDQDGSFTKMNVGLTPVYNATIALGDYNQDGYLDILLAGEGYEPVSALWKNNGDLTFTKVDASLADLGGTNAEFRDIDNDGDLDILLSGSIRNQDGSYSEDLRIYSNVGNDTFEEFDLSFTAYANVGTLGDFDNDGDLDLIIGGGALEVYNNNGDGSFSSPINLGLSFTSGTIKCFDYNNDQYLDIVIAGNSITDVLINNQDGSFSPLGGSFDILQRQKIDLRDYNSDGFTDLLLVGTEDFTNNAFITKIYENSGTGFSQNSNISLPQLGNGDGKWFDIDNDGDLDLVLTGEEVQGATVKRTFIYQNDGNENNYSVNLLPTAPAVLSWTWTEDQIVFSWESGSDDKTPVEALSYNLGIGTNSEAINILFPESDADGIRFIQEVGNSQKNTQKIISNLEDGLYFFKVQTIDGALAGSAFSEPEHFAVGIPAQPTNAEVTLHANNDLLINWTDNSNNEFSFVVEQKSNLTAEYIKVGSVTTNEVSFTVSNLEDAIYTFRIKAINPNGGSEYVESNNIAIGIPASPSNFQATLIDSEILLSWDDLINERNYHLERSDDNGESYEELINLEANTQEFLDQNLSAGTYSYRIKAINENGESDFVYSGIAIEVVLSIVTLVEQDFEVYPNPVHNNFVYVKTPDNYSPYGISISDLNGRILNLPTTAFNGTFEIDMASVQPGIYIIKLEKNGEFISKRVIIE